jgi:hypothetical protein
MLKWKAIRRRRRRRREVIFWIQQYPEDGGSRFLQNVSICLPNNMASYHRKPLPLTT